MQQITLNNWLAAQEHDFGLDAALSRVTLRGPAQDVLAALQALSVYFPGKSCRISG